MRLLRLIVVAGLIAGSGLAAAGVCDWNSPGRNRYVGSVPDAIDRLPGFTPGQRAQLKAMAEARVYTEAVTLVGGQVVGPTLAYGEIQHMHFGAGQVCDRVDWSRWPSGTSMRGVVLVPDGASKGALIPEGCNNVSVVAVWPRRDVVAPPSPSPLDGWAPGRATATDPREAFDAARAEASRPRLWAGQGSGPQTPVDPDPEVRPVPEPGALALALVAVAASLAGRSRPTRS